MKSVNSKSTHKNLSLLFTSNSKKLLYNMIELTWDDDNHETQERTWLESDSRNDHFGFEMSANNTTAKTLVIGEPWLLYQLLKQYKKKD